MVLEISKEWVQDYYKAHFPSDQYTYHSWERIEAILGSATAICEHEQCDEADHELLRLAILFHDLGLHINRDTHEQESAAIAEQFLTGQNHAPDKIAAVSELILSTEESHIPRTTLEAILKDSILSHFAADAYFEMLDGLRQEWETFDIHHPESDEAFYTLVIDYCNRNRYYTDAATLLFPKYKSNLRRLKQIRKEIRTQQRDRDTETIVKKPSLNTNRTGQMVLKTSLRNHLELTELADRKASTMLSINSLIITIAIPLMLPSLQSNRYLAIPIILLLLCCVVSILFATLVTKPLKMAGYTSDLDIERGDADLFFFGNFFNMPFEQYESSMRMVLMDNDKLDRMIIRDLYLSGRVLGEKFNQLRLCYMIFLVGIVASIITLLGVLWFAY